MGTRKRRIPHLGRDDRRGRMVHHGAGRIPDSIRRRARADLRQNACIHHRNGALRLDAGTQQPLEKGERHRRNATETATTYAGRYYPEPA